ncbi:TonB-dependent receptor plug domain-containing protein [Pelagicoccus mobilis]|uniref:TonB-dependent receptor n=1 Tax=Pelagicoccus mobilis TaxID=415221 RepID=A0A934RS98_9BACT|nr:TonB-dependent receptor [Pelagicoccus mobilis]MBK1875426.1 TonB-dependent receptor [Pelagicoccus mobilis]
MKYLNVLRGCAVSKKALLGSAALSLLAAPLFAQSEDDQEEEKIRIVGSRISRIDAEPIAPVTRMTAEDLENTGFSTVGDALRAVPFNSGQSLTPDDASNSFTPGASSFNLRGLGNGNTLVLINGVRAVPFSQPGFNGFQSVFDFNSLPVDAIEEIQILKDGGSAIYGSDAVAGVINIELAKDFEGMSAQAYYGNTEGHDSAEQKIFFITGTSSAKTSMVTTIDFYTRNSVNTRDLPFTRDADTRPLDKRDGPWFTFDDAGERIDGVDWRSSRPYPGRFVDPASGRTLTFPSLSQNQDPANAVPPSNVTGHGFYNYQEDILLFPELKNYGFYTHIEHEVSDTITAYADLSYRHIDIYNYAAAAPYSTADKGDGQMRIPLGIGYDSVGDPDGLITDGDRVLAIGNTLNPYNDQEVILRNVPGAMVMPVENPNNPYNQDIQITGWRLNSGAKRQNDVVVNYPRMVGGLRGELGFTWEWDAYLTYSQSSYENANPGTAFESRLQESLRGVVNPSTGITEFSNPFGPETDWVGTYYTGTNPTRSQFNMFQASASAAGELFDMPAGAASLAAGVEFRKSSLSDTRTIENATGNIIGGSEGFGTEGDRNVVSLYAEMDIPVHETIDIQIAARHEDYSDFGTTTKPKIGAKWRPLDWLLVRASHSEAFKAPDLAALYSQGQVTFTSGGKVDPLRPNDAPEQMKQLTPGNPILDPEETDVDYAGVVIEAGKLWDKLDNFEIGIDYFKFDQENLLTQSSADTILANELNPNFAGGRVIRQPLIPGDVDPITGDPYTVGVIEQITRPFYNADEYTYEGMDLDFRYLWETENHGDFRFQVSSTVLFENRTVTIDQTTGERDDQGNLVGEWNGLAPKWRAAGTIAWRREDWAASLYTTYVSGLDYATWPAPDLGSHFIFNPQVSYSGYWDTKITFGIRNLLDEEPPRDITQTNGGYLSGVYPWEPRFFFLRFERDF